MEVFSKDEDGRRIEGVGSVKVDGKTVSGVRIGVEGDAVEVGG